MSDHRSNTDKPSASSNGPSMWGAKKLIDGVLFRQCQCCRKWFHIGWIAYHNCRAPLPRSH